jgi:hypothetical protein
MGIDEMARPDSILNFDYVEEFWTGDNPLWFCKESLG